MPKYSPRKSASIERSVIVRKIRRMKGEYSYPLAQEVLNKLEAWLYERVPRFKAKKGGL